jgi:hypothetical protein
MSGGPKRFNRINVEFYTRNLKQKVPTVTARPWLRCVEGFVMLGYAKISIEPMSNVWAWAAVGLAYWAFTFVKTVRVYRHPVFRFTIPQVVILLVVAPISPIWRLFRSSESLVRRHHAAPHPDRAPDGGLCYNGRCSKRVHGPRPQQSCRSRR